MSSHFETFLQPSELNEMVEMVPCRRQKPLTLHIVVRLAPAFGYCTFAWPKPRGEKPVGFHWFSWTKDNYI